MGEVRALYRRVFQVRPYETETVELSVQDEAAAGPLVEEVRDLYAALAEVGDDIVVARMARAPKLQTDPEPTGMAPGPGKHRPLPDPWASA